MGGNCGDGAPASALPALNTGIQGVSLDMCQSLGIGCHWMKEVLRVIPVFLTALSSIESIESSQMEYSAPEVFGIYPYSEMLL